MRIAFFVNQVATEIDEYTTTRLALAAGRLGHEVWYVGADDVDYEPDGSIRARAHRAEWKEADTLTSFLARTQDGRSEEHIALDELDAVMLRNDSVEDLHDRPWATNLGTVFGTALSARGVMVVNNPSALSRASSKLYLQGFPASIRPSCLVTRDEDAIRDFVARTGEVVLKPLYGAKGRNVFVVTDEKDPNLSQIIEAVLEDGYVFAQEFIRDDEKGDTRLFLLEGEALESEGRYAAVRRVPQDEDVRANISTGAKPEAASIGETELAIARAMKDRLVKDGMFFVGIDIVGDKVVEINAESPGGLQSVQHFTEIDFAPVVISNLERRLSEER